MKTLSLFIFLSFLALNLDAQSNSTSSNKKEKGDCITYEKDWHDDRAPFIQVSSEKTTREVCDRKAKLEEKESLGLFKVKFVPSTKKYSKKTPIARTKKRRKL